MMTCGILRKEIYVCHQRRAQNLWLILLACGIPKKTDWARMLLSVGACFASERSVKLKLVCACSVLTNRQASHLCGN
jgi:hypothetical protein